MNTQRNPNHVRLVIPNRPEYLRVVRLVVSGYLSRWDIPFDTVENIKVAVSEACNNAIQHAYDETDECDIELDCWGNPSELHFDVMDTGRGLKPMPAADETPEVSDERGLGFLLISTLMDDVKVTSEPGKGTSVCMTKNIGG